MVPEVEPTPQRTLAAQVARVRDASRRMVRELGMLTGRVGGRTTTQCHALLEVERTGRKTPSELAEDLRLDRSTLTRALAPLIEAGELRVVRDPANRRSRPVGLTARGQRRVDELDRRADEQVGTALALLSPEERERVCGALALYADALRRARGRAGVEIGPLRARDQAAMARIIRRVMPEFGVSGPGTALEDPEVDQLHATYRRPGSAFFVARRADTVLGGGGIAPLRGGPQGVCELQKLYLLPETRGLGLGRDLLAACLDAARRLGYRLCYLETVDQMVQARRLYESVGFRKLSAPLGDTGHYRCGGWYSLELDAG